MSGRDEGPQRKRLKEEDGEVEEQHPALNPFLILFSLMFGSAHKQVQRLISGLLRAGVPSNATAFSLVFMRTHGRIHCETLDYGQPPFAGTLIFERSFVSVSARTLDAHGRVIAQRALCDFASSSRSIDRIIEEFSRNREQVATLGAENVQPIRLVSEAVVSEFLAAKDAKIEEAERRNQELREQLQAETKNKDSLATELRELAATHEHELKKERNRLDENMDNLATELREKTASLDEMQLECNRLREERTDAQRQLGEEKTRVGGMEQSIVDMTSQLGALVTERNALEREHVLANVLQKSIAQDHFNTVQLLLQAEWTRVAENGVELSFNLVPGDLGETHVHGRRLETDTITTAEAELVERWAALETLQCKRILVPGGEVVIVDGENTATINAILARGAVAVPADLYHPSIARAPMVVQDATQSLEIRGLPLNVTKQKVQDFLRVLRVVDVAITESDHVCRVSFVSSQAAISAGNYLQGLVISSVPIRVRTICLKPTAEQ